MVDAPRLVSAVAIMAAALSACSSSDDVTETTDTATHAVTTVAAPTLTPIKRAPIPVLGEEPAPQPKGSISAPRLLSLRVMESPVGPILVTPSGRSVYYYLADDPKTGKSACDVQCSIHWPAVNANTDPPQGDGVDAELGLYDRPEGTSQVTVNGRPVYFYRNDVTPGSINGQGLGGVWWLVGAKGQMIKPR